MIKNIMKKINFDKIRKRIKKHNYNKLCWNCKYFRGYYFDEVTFDCKKLGDNQMWDFEGDNCEYYEKS